MLGSAGEASMATHLGQFRRFAQYNAWFNGRLYEHAAALTEDERRRDLGTFFHSIHGTLNHILLTDRIWLGRFSRHPHGFRALDKTPLVFEFESLSQVLCEQFSDLLAQRRETDAAIESWVAELTPEILASDFHTLVRPAKAWSHLSGTQWPTCLTTRPIIVVRSRRCSLNSAAIPG